MALGRSDTGRGSNVICLLTLQRQDIHMSKATLYLNDSIHQSLRLKAPLNFHYHIRLFLFLTPANQGHSGQNQAETEDSQ